MAHSAHDPCLPSLQDYEQAIGLLTDTLRLGAGPIGERWIDRAILHLHRKGDRLLRDHPALDSEQVALALIKSTADELRQVGQALTHAAEALKRSNQVPIHAARAHQAAQRALQAAEELHGG